jgi:hypothetical protein
LGRAFVKYRTEAQWHLPPQQNRSRHDVTVARIAAGESFERVGAFEHHTSLLRASPFGTRAIRRVACFIRPLPGFQSSFKGSRGFVLDELAAIIVEGDSGATLGGGGA